MHVDGDETETSALLKSKLRDHANRAVFKHHILEVTVDEQLKWRTHNY